MPSDSTVRQAVLARFLPACGIVILSVPAGLSLVAPHYVGWGMFATGVTHWAALTAGFGAVLTLRRDRLAPPPRLGFRSVAAGVLAPLIVGLVSSFMQGANLPIIVILGLATGAATGALLVAAHRRRQPQPNA